MAVSRTYPSAGSTGWDRPGAATDATDATGAGGAGTAKSAGGVPDGVLAGVLAATDLSMIITDRNGIIKVFNPGAERLLGYTPTEVVGRYAADIFHRPDELAARAAALGVRVDLAAVAATRQGTAGFPTWTYVRKDGGTVPVRLTVSPVRGHTGETIAYLHVARDVSADEAAVGALRLGYERERGAVARMREFDQAKDEVIAVTSHDLRTPLTSLMSYHELLLDGPELTEDQRHLITAAHRNAHRVLALADGLLAVAKMEAGGPALNRWPVPLGDVARGALEALAGAISDRRLTVAVAAMDGIVVNADAGQLERVLTNLISNAVKFTPDGGVITITAARGPRAVEITVRDSGVGIPADEVPYLFDRFFRSPRTRAEVSGTGLGLAIAKAIVQAHGGSIEVDSTPGVGSTFTFTIPHRGPDDTIEHAGASLVDVHEALRRVRLPDLERAWTTMLDRAGLVGDESDRPSLERMIGVLLGHSPVARVVGLSQRIRADSPGYDQEWYGAAGRDQRLEEAVRALVAPLAAPRRVQALARYDLCHPVLRERLDEISRRTAARLDSSTGMVSIVLDGAQFFAGAHGLEDWIARTRGTPVEWAFCAHGVRTRQPYVVTDATAHPAHLSSPLVTMEGVRAYAGAQIVEPGGQALGMHCVTGTSPRTFTDRQIVELRHAAEEVATVLEAYRVDTAPTVRERRWSSRPGRFIRRLAG